MSRTQAALASFGAALLPEERGGPTSTEFAERVDRYLSQLPTTSRLAVRAGLVSLAAASYLTTGRSLARLEPAQREQVLRRVAAINPDTSAALEGSKRSRCWPTVPTPTHRTCLPAPRHTTPRVPMRRWTSPLPRIALRWSPPTW